jgi:hypothetical protein
MIDLDPWPEGARLILRKERPHPGAQLRFTDVDGMRVTAVLTDTPAGVVPGQAAGLELLHRQQPGSKTGSARPKPAAYATFPAGPGTRTPPGSRSS